MACLIPPRPPQTGPLATLPSDAHAFAQAYLDQCLANHSPTGTYERVVHNGQPIVRFFDVHTICNGTPGCCPAVTLLADLAPPGTPGGAVPMIDWPTVAWTGLAAAGAVGLFFAMLHFAGGAGRRRR